MDEIYAEGSAKSTREKLAIRGVETLEDYELISIVIGQKQPIEKAKRILESAGGNLYSFSQMGLTEARMCGGMGISNAAVLLSAIELGRRVERANQQQVEVISNNDDVINIFHPLLSRLSHEEFWVLYLNRANRILDRVRVSQGTISDITVDNKLIIKRAIEKLASGVIVVHNHPSGDPQPSPRDVEITKKLAEASMLFDIELLDHIIISSSGNVSFKHLGLI